MIYFASDDDDDDEDAIGGDDDDNKGLTAAGGREAGLAFDIAVLLGVTDATPNVAVKGDLGISF